MTRATSWLAPRLARVLLAFAVTVGLLAFAISALAWHIAAWPYRRLTGPSRSRALFEAALELARALVVFTRLLRALRE